MQRRCNDEVRSVVFTVCGFGCYVQCACGLIVILVLLFGGGGGYYAHSIYGGTGLGGVLGLVLIIAVVVWLVGGRRGA